MPASVNGIATFKGFETVFSRFVSVAIGLVALVCIAMLVLGGLKFLTAGADKEGAASAQRTITFGLIGLIITISAWIILSLIGTFLGVDLSTFYTTL